jgi:hypothetical protein
MQTVTLVDKGSSTSAAIPIASQVMNGLELSVRSKQAVTQWSSIGQMYFK